MLVWPALCGLAHIKVSKNPLLFCNTKNQKCITHLTLSGGSRYVNKDKSSICHVNNLLICKDVLLDFSNS